MKARDVVAELVGVVIVVASFGAAALAWRAWRARARRRAVLRDPHPSTRRDWPDWRAAAPDRRH